MLYQYTSTCMQSTASKLQNISWPTSHCYLRPSDDSLAHFTSFPSRTSPQPAQCWTFLTGAAVPFFCAFHIQPPMYLPFHTVTHALPSPGPCGTCIDLTSATIYSESELREMRGAKLDLHGAWRRVYVSHILADTADHGAVARCHITRLDILE